MTAIPHVLVMGAGSVGCHVGGCLQAAGARVDFVGRPRVLADLHARGLRLTDRDGRDQHLPPSALRLHLHVPSGLKLDLVLLCVKSGATEDAARELARELPAGTPVLSLQNGLNNAVQAASVAPTLTWLAGMVPFNIAELASGHFHRGTDGHLAAQDHARLHALTDLFDRAGLPMDLHADLRPVQLGKLLLNLNNPVNALSGMPLRAQLLSSRHRRQFAALMREALDLMRLDGTEPARLTPLPWDVLIAALRLPAPLFRLVASRMLKIDPQARSSMADDLAAGRPTEIDALSGEIVRLASRLGRVAPLNANMVAHVRAFEGTRTAPTPKT
jgi:2-dehydropantoate 2-reductase